MNFTDKKIAVLGLGIEGLDLVAYLHKKKAKITGFDIKTKNELSEIIPKLKRLGIKLSLGENYLKEGLLGFDYIFRSPAIRLTRPELMKAKAVKIPILSATKLFFDLCPGKIIGVTGTKGKGTTATLIFKILKESGKKVFLLGNIGKPPLRLLSRMDKETWVVFELSSFQLQDLDKSPHIAVVLFITSDHLDYHPSTAAYIKAKMPIVSFQSNKDIAVINADYQASASFSKLTTARIFYYSRFNKTNGVYINNKKEIVLLANSKNHILGATTDLKILGEHNWDNVSMASLATYLAGADLESIKKVIFSFSGLEHRLEMVTKIKNIIFYNDSFSTTPETTIAAIKSFDQPLILIAGGSEKGSDFSQLGKEITHSSTKSLILIGKMAARIKQAVINENFQGLIIEGLKTMDQVVEKAFDLAQPGMVVLLSPACASFDLFKDYKDRGNQFKKAVFNLKNLFG